MHITPCRTVAVVLSIVGVAQSAHAIQYNNGRFAFKLSGHGSAGILQPEFEKSDFIGDWRVRTQMNYAVASGQTVGAVYALDDAALDENRPLRRPVHIPHWTTRHWTKTDHCAKRSVFLKTEIMVAWKLV